MTLVVCRLCVVSPSSAMIVIRIKNRGDNAFQPEMYGDSIIIERRIAMDSSGSYKIKSAHG